MRIKKYILGILIVLTLYLTVGCSSFPTTGEERAAYGVSRTQEYKVVSVYQYIAVQTNNFGAVLDQELKYCFSYIGNDGQLHQFDNFEHIEYGLWKIYIGNENKYVIKNDGIDTYRYLYLTEETLNNMPTE